MNDLKLWEVFDKIGGGTRLRLGKDKDEALDNVRRTYAHLRDIETRFKCRPVDCLVYQDKVYKITVVAEEVA